MAPQETQAPRGSVRRRHRPLVVMGFLGGLVALAMWGKLRFVSDVPRMAYADPKQSVVTDEASDGSPGSGDDRASGEPFRPSP